jgi:hypothetical protein
LCDVIDPYGFSEGDGGVDGVLSSFAEQAELIAHVAQLAERVLGKDEVISSTLIMGSSLAGNRAEQISRAG